MLCSCARLLLRERGWDGTKGMSLVLCGYLKLELIRVSVVQELRGRFTEYLKTGDDSKIPGNLQAFIFVTVCPYTREDDLVLRPPFPFTREEDMVAVKSSKCF
jgi:hypothetical protein